MSPFIFITDTETTGFSNKMHDMITMSCEVRDLDFNLVGEFELFAKPKSRERWTDKAAEIHGYSWSEACNFGDSRKEAIRLLHFLKEFKTEDNLPLLFVAHENNKFDYNFLKAFFMNQGLIDSFYKVFNENNRISTIDLARKKGYSENKLNVWADRIGFKLNHHNAESDRKCCSRVFEYLIGVSGELELN